jgi:hypothetical protein
LGHKDWLGCVSFEAGISMVEPGLSLSKGSRLSDVPIRISGVWKPRNAEHVYSTA